MSWAEQYPELVIRNSKTVVKPGNKIMSCLTCGNVGQSEYSFNPCRTASSDRISNVENLMSAPFKASTTATQLSGQPS